MKASRHAAGVDRAVLAQHAQHAPLLVGQRVLAQAGPGVGHHGFACLQQKARQVAMSECGAQGLSLPKLLNMLNESSRLS
jgi:hypothetical protein